MDDEKIRKAVEAISLEFVETERIMAELHKRLPAFVWVAEMGPGEGNSPSCVKVGCNCAPYQAFGLLEYGRKFTGEAMVVDFMREGDENEGDGLLE